jgi:hypothetical protein
VPDGIDSKPGVISRIASVFAGRKPKLVEQSTNAAVLGDNPEAIQSSLPFSWGPTAGWLDSNAQFTKSFLHGDTTTPGKLLEIRRTDDVIAPAVDSRVEMLAGLHYGVRPRARFLNDDTAARAAIEVNAHLDSMPGTSKAWWVSQTYDSWFTSGFSLDEIALDAAGRVELLRIRPGLINQFNPDGTGRGFESVQVRTRASISTIDARKLSYVPRMAQAGEFWGESGLRCMIATAETSLQLYTALLQALRYSMGFPWLSDQGEGFVSNGDKNNAMKAMSDLLKGETDIAYFGKKVAPNILSSQTPAMQQFAPLAQFQAERKQAAARNALNNLGMRGVGSRSLGEVIKDSDMQAVKGHLDLFMKSVSGDHQSSGSLLRTLTEYSGYDPVYTPEIFIDWNSGQSERKSLDHVRLAAELVRDGVIGKTPEIEEWLIGQLIQLAAGDA